MRRTRCAPPRAGDSIRVQVTLAGRCPVARLRIVELHPRHQMHADALGASGLDLGGEAGQHPVLSLRCLRPAAGQPLDKEVGGSTHPNDLASDAGQQQEHGPQLTAPAIHHRRIWGRWVEHAMSELC